MIDLHPLNLPVYPGDTVYTVWDDDEIYRLTAEHVYALVFTDDNRMKLKLDLATDGLFELGIEDHVYASLPEAMKAFSSLSGGKLFYPSENRNVKIVLKDGRIVPGYYSADDPVLPHGFYDLTGGESSEDLTESQKLPDDMVYAW